MKTQNIYLFNENNKALIKLSLRYYAIKVILDLSLLSCQPNDVYINENTKQLILHFKVSLIY
jgi:hypothetical protein